MRTFLDPESIMIYPVLNIVIMNGWGGLGLQTHTI